MHESTFAEGPETAAGDVFARLDSDSLGTAVRVPPSLTANLAGDQGRFDPNPAATHESPAKAETAAKPDSP